MRRIGKSDREVSREERSGRGRSRKRERSKEHSGERKRSRGRSRKIRSREGRKRSRGRSRRLDSAGRRGRSKRRRSYSRKRSRGSRRRRYSEERGSRGIRYRSRERERSRGSLHWRDRREEKDPARNAKDDTPSLLRSLIKALKQPAGNSGEPHLNSPIVERELRRKEFLAAARRLPDGDTWKEKVKAQLNLTDLDASSQV